MQELLRTVLIYAVVLAVILGGFYLYKDNRYKVTIEASDRSMTPEFITGAQKIDVYSPIQAGDAVAFALPGKPDEWRVARVVAVAGQTVAVDGKGGVKVDGKANSRTCSAVARPVEFKVPGGSVFLLTDVAGYTDSTQLGPLPLEQIIGKLKPSGN